MTLLGDEFRSGGKKAMDRIIIDTCGKKGPLWNQAPRETTQTRGRKKEDRKKKEKKATRGEKRERPRKRPCPSP